MKFILFSMLALLSTSAYAAPHFCSGQVKDPAVKLFALHFGEDMDQATAAKAVSNDVVEQSPVLSPDGKKNYAVLETHADYGKMGQYRIRMIFDVRGNSNAKEDCVLMGEEILDMTSL